MRKPERIHVEEVSDILGIEPRTVQSMAAAGKIPSAAKIGRHWSFNETAVRTFLREEEIRCQSEKRRAEHIGAMASYGAAFGTRANQHSGVPLIQTIRESQRNALKRSRLN